MKVAMLFTCWQRDVHWVSLITTRQNGVESGKAMMSKLNSPNSTAATKFFLVRAVGASPSLADAEQFESWRYRPQSRWMFVPHETQGWRTILVLGSRELSVFSKLDVFLAYDLLHWRSVNNSAFSVTNSLSSVCCVVQHWFSGWRSDWITPSTKRALKIFLVQTDPHLKVLVKSCCV